MQSNITTQIYTAQSIVKEFVQRKDPDFQSFISVWRDLNGKTIHNFPSPRPLIFGRIQSAYQTFLGFVLFKSKEIEIASGIYGLYLLYETQNGPIKEQIILTSDELLIIQAKVSKLDFLVPILQHLIHSQAFVFSAASYAVRTPRTEYPQKSVLSDRPQYSHIMETKKEKLIKQKYLLHIEKEDTTADEEQYKALLSEIFPQQNTN